MKDGTLIPTAKLRGSAMPGIVKAFEKGVVGKKIVKIGYVAMGDVPYPVLVLDDGTTIMALSDDECNGPGSLDFCAKNEKDNALLCRTSV